MACNSLTINECEIYWRMYIGLHCTAVAFTIFNSVGNTKTSLVCLDTFLLNLMKDFLNRGFVKFSTFCSLAFYGQDLEFRDRHVNMLFHCQKILYLYNTLKKINCIFLEIPNCWRLSRHIYFAPNILGQYIFLTQLQVFKISSLICEIICDHILTKHIFKLLIPVPISSVKNNGTDLKITS